MLASWIIETRKTLREPICHFVSSNNGSAPECRPGRNHSSLNNSVLSSRGFDSVDPPNPFIEEALAVHEALERA